MQSFYTNQRNQNSFIWKDKEEKNQGQKVIKETTTIFVTKKASLGLLPVIP
jgi:hypothetical protein